MLATFGALATGSGGEQAKVAIEAIRGEKTINEIASIYEVHPNQVGKWKKLALEKLSDVMADGRSKDARPCGCVVDEDKLHQKIGRQPFEIDFLKKSYVSWDYQTSRDD